MLKSSAKKLQEETVNSKPESLIRVLHVDDDDDFLKCSKRFLELQDSFQIETALSVKEALQKISKKQYDVIVSDYQMPEIDGLEFLQELRNSGNDVPFILFTGRNREGIVIEALNLGADRYFNKNGKTKTLYGELVHGIINAVKAKRAEKQVTDAVEKYETIFEQAPDSIITFDLSGVVTSCNTTSAVMSGYSKDEIVGKNVSDLIDLCVNDSQKLMTSINSLQEGKMPEPLEIKYHHKNGRIAFGEVHTSVIKKGGTTIGFQAIMRDITARKKIEETLRRERETFELITANIGAGLTIISKDYKILWANKFLKNACGEDVKGKTCYKVYNDRTSVCPGCGVKEIFETGKNRVIHEQSVPCPGGKRAWLEITANPIRDEKGNIVAASELSVFLDERKQLEKKLREAESRYHALFDKAPLGIVIVDSTGTAVEFNDEAHRQLGYSREEFAKLTVSDYEALETPKEIEARMEKVLKTGKDEFETKHRTKTGEFRDVINTVQMIELSGKKFFHLITRDITERKKAREAVRQSEKSYRTVFENTGTAMCILEEDKTISMINRRFEELSGYSREEVEGKKWIEFVTKDYLERMQRYHEARRKKGEKAPNHYAVNFATKKGQIKRCMITVNIIPGTKKSVASILDLTDSKKSEKALRETEKNYRKTILSANVGIIGYGPEGEVKVLNPKMEQMTGFKRSELPTLQDWFKRLYPNKEERLKIRDKWFKKMSEKGEVKEGHAIITTKEGKRRNFLFNGVRLESGDSIAFAEDITERKEAEEKLDRIMNELVTINEKLGVVGRLTRHDARNKLSIISNNIYLAKQKLPANHKSSVYLCDVESAIDQMEKIFDFARTYEMLGVEELSYMDVGKSVEEAAILLSGLNEVTLMNKCEGLTVMADSLLRQLFYNLIDDTLKHGEKVSQIRVHYEEEENRLKLVYEDDGVGIPENEKEKIFREGYGKGTGYGLYLIQKICEAYGWTIRETGKQGKGAQFTMTIPKTTKNGKESYRFDNKKGLRDN